MRTSLFFSLLLVLGFFLGGCASDEKNANEPEGLFNIAKDYEKEERYEEAIKKFTDVKNKFPYSAWATKAELAIADVYFKQESFAEAQAAYLTFRELHPKHAQIDYVIFRIGLSYYSQLPETIDRDLSLANDSIKYFDEIITRFPTSEYAKEATEKKEICLKKLAEKEEYIAYFYFRRKMYDSALNRYENLLNKYSGLGFDAKALSGAAISAKHCGEAVKAQKYLTTLKEKYPDSAEYDAARKVVK